jgi:proteasome lid subunit RPN8/RPN11
LIPIVIPNEILERIRSEIDVPHEQIGLLIGEFSDNQLVIYDAISGTSSANRSLSILSPEILAEVADDILNGRINGRIIGWYHSHLGSGVFMSPIDIETHSRLLQFSNDVIAMVMDSVANQFGIFIYDAQSGSLVQLPEEYISIV